MMQENFGIDFAIGDDCVCWKKCYYLHIMQTDLVATTEGNVGMPAMKKAGGSSESFKKLGYGSGLPKPKTPSAAGKVRKPEIRKPEIRMAGNR